MINFSDKNFSGSYGNDEEKKEILKNHTDRIQKDLNESKTNFFYLGLHLLDLYNSDAYSVVGYDREQLRMDLHLPIGAGNCHSAFFFAYCFDTFGLDKTQISRYMNIVDEFGNEAIGFTTAWNKYSYSQLCELLPLTPEQRKKVKPVWTIKQIREYKKSLVATSQQEKIDIPEAEEPLRDERYERFRKWTKNELCDKIFDLETERDELQKELERLRSSMLEKAG